MISLWERYRVGYFCNRRVYSLNKEAATGKSTQQKSEHNNTYMIVSFLEE